MRLLRNGIFLLAFTLFPIISHAERFQSIGTTDVYFSPRGGATEAIVQEINSAKS